MSVPDDPATHVGETAALARGGRTSFFGFLLRLMARLPFLFIAGRMYGAVALGRFAYATMVVELVAALATLGLKRGLATELAAQERPENHVVADGLALGLLLALAGALLLVALPLIVFPDRQISGFDRLFPIIIIGIVASDISLAALAFRHDIAATVRARSLIEPWVLSVVALLLAFTWLKTDGLLIAYALSLGAAMLASLWPCVRAFGVPRGWRPHPGRLSALAAANVPLAGADVAEWGARRLDVFILGRFFGSEVIGIYYVAQQITSLPQRLKSSFDPILAPVLTKNLADGNFDKVAGHVRQVAFWVGVAQLGAVISLGFTGKASMGLFGPAFAAGAAVLVMLLTAELLAAQAAVAESALIYVAPNVNLAWSLAGLAVQIAVSLWLVPIYGGVGAAAGLATAALFLSVGKSALLARRLGHSVSGWRWSILAGAVPGFLTGYAVMQLPEWVQLSVGWLLIVGVFGAILWRWSFKGPDRLLFARRLKIGTAEAPPA